MTYKNFLIDTVINFHLESFLKFLELFQACFKKKILDYIYLKFLYNFKSLKFFYKTIDKYLYFIMKLRPIG